ncbi:GPI ethanolamine phosphate transferase 2, C-terminal [Dillenia turbinata]|uniref:GPI ethanolamine phosphate transferase 2, C-terminal n=1 Tax=Dillenia turbinata TaxID=194707 RepID=A0AAN8V5L5_9MAGN
MPSLYPLFYLTINRGQNVALAYHSACCGASYSVSSKRGALVIDGLPAEFVLGKDGRPPSKEMREAMPYTQLLLANQMAVGYHAKAAPPTVTMPRLKAMVSGAPGGFLDVALNFNTQAFLDDNLIGQFFGIGWNMVMHGDETWIKLFPRLFKRHDGVSSFFIYCKVYHFVIWAYYTVNASLVKDTVEVDHNVSRHLQDELNRNDWDLLVSYRFGEDPIGHTNVVAFKILHYLGVDHVGHISGRNSVLMAPKLNEMDEVIKILHSSCIHSQGNVQKRTLLVCASLMVVSDHGMTDSGNHGGSSFEETDSLVLFMGQEFTISDYLAATHNTIHQTCKENVHDQQLRALELNSWQLFRLLRVHLPGLSCKNSPCDGFNDDQQRRTNECNGSKEKMFCCLYLNAKMLHDSWKSKDDPRFFLDAQESDQIYKEKKNPFYVLMWCPYCYFNRSISRDDFSQIISAYYSFLRSASEWLSHKATDKPIGLLSIGVAAMIISCCILLRSLVLLRREFYPREGKRLQKLELSNQGWHLDKFFAIFVILMLVICMGSSSLVEEEQYIWHFATTTMHFLLLHETIQSSLGGTAGSSISFTKGKGEKNNGCFQLCCIFTLLICGRILRGWHQGGVNWSHLPDIARWLEQDCGDHVKSIQLVSGLFVISLSFIAMYLSRLKRIVVVLFDSIFAVCGFLVLRHLTSHKGNSFTAFDDDSTMPVQIIYVTLLILTVCILTIVPWLLPLWNPNISSSHDCPLTSIIVDIEQKSLQIITRGFAYIIGWTYIVCWCLLQLLLQQPINSVPISILLLQISIIIFYFHHGELHHEQWVEVALLCYLGMAGHYGLGNSNSLATIDVAGAFIVDPLPSGIMAYPTIPTLPFWQGMSRYSTVLSGILMFMITFASPMLFLLGLVVYIFVKDTSHLIRSESSSWGQNLMLMLGFPCLTPLGLNSILLTAYTIVLLQMRNHLFVWSVFSPKYLYVCATTACVYIGVSIVAVTGIYLYLVANIRIRWLRMNRHDTERNLAHQ